MSGVGIASIVLGVIVVCGRLPFVVSPAPILRWLRRLVASDSRIRVLGACFVPPGVAMVWVGNRADGELAGVVMFVGLWILGWDFLLFIAFPAGYRFLIERLVPQEPEGSFIGWRLVGLASVAVGVIFIIAGMRAL